MKISIYDLIGLIQRGDPPKEIKYDGEIYYYNNELCDYDSPAKGICLLELMFGGGIDWLHTEVKILPEENDEWEDIEEISFVTKETQKEKNKLMKYAINRLIANQKYLKERLDNVKDDVVFDCWKDKVSENK